MDLCLTKETARAAVIWTLNAIGLVLLVWTCSVYGSDSPAGRDYLFPAESNGGKIHLLSTTEASGSASKQSTHIQYEAFDGQLYQSSE